MHISFIVPHARPVLVSTYYAKTAPCYTLLRQKYLSQHAILERPRPTFLNLRDRTLHPYNSTGKISSGYLNRYIFGQQTGRQNLRPILADIH